jgi:hypothetical protein
MCQGCADDPDRMSNLFGQIAGRLRVFLRKCEGNSSGRGNLIT